MSLKQEIINKIKGSKTGKEIKYEETQILKNKSEFNNEIKNKSLFRKQDFLLEDAQIKYQNL